jgi:ubiquinone/menaquinone biosynthesis C-methylase UbiE
MRAAEETGVRELARLLELRGQSEDQTSIRSDYLDLLQLTPGERVLDVGCGTGVATRAVARRVAPAGRVVGIDPSPVMLAVAREIAEREGVAELVDLQVGDARALPVEDASFDVVLAITALSHTTDADRDRRLARPAPPGLARSGWPPGCPGQGVHGR